MSVGRGRRIAAVLVTATALTGTAGASGGETIASAPEVRYEATFVGGGSAPSNEYFLAPLGAGDHLFVELEAVDPTAEREFRVDVFHPDTTDATVESAPSAAVLTTQTAQQVRFVARAPGRWILRFRSPAGAYYEAMAAVQRFTTATLLGPGRLGVGRRGIYRGAVAGARQGAVLIQSRGPRGWRMLGTARLHGGTFSIRSAFPRRGTVRLRAVFSGDRDHRPSVSNVVTTRVG